MKIKAFWARMKRFSKTARFKNMLVAIGGLAIISFGALLIAFSSISLPTLDTFSERKVSESTKIYDRTGNVLLYDVHQEIRRTVVAFDEISPYVK
jgi:membrane peptidoglycan carboxypeptidase